MHHNFIADINKTHLNIVNIGSCIYARKSTPGKNKFCDFKWRKFFLKKFAVRAYYGYAFHWGWIYAKLLREKADMQYGVVYR